jgi:hypothetical protein
MYIKGFIIKKIIVFMLIFPTYLLALDFSQTYLDAMKAYKAKDFQTSYTLLSKLYLTNLSDVNLNFSLGMSAYETAHYEIALAAFERVEMLSPTNLRNKLEKARTYFMLKMYEEAELSFRVVLNNPQIPKNVRTNIELYLAQVAGVQKKSFTYATVNLDWIYNSNVNTRSLDDTIDTSYGPLKVPEDKLSDSALQFSADIVNIYDIGVTNGFALKNSGSVYIKDYNKENDYNIAYAAYTPSLVYKYTKYTAEMIFGIDTMSLAKNSYLNTLYLMPRFEYAHSNMLKSIAYFKYQRKNFQQSAQSDLDANHYELSYGLQNILTPRSYVQANVTAIKEKKRQGSSPNVDYKEYKLDAIYSNQFTPTYGIELYGEIKKRNYDDLSPLYNFTRRDDTSKTISASISAKVLQTLRVHVKALYSRVDSNQNVFSYQKYTMSLGVTKTF